MAHPSAPECRLETGGLPRNLFSASLQLLAWVFFTPSSWSRYVTSLGPDLQPDFALCELTLAQWWTRGILRLVFILMAIIPIYVGVLVGILLWLTGTATAEICYGVGSGIGASVASGIIISIVLGMHHAVGAVVVAGLLNGVSHGIGSRLARRAAGSFAAGVISRLSGTGIVHSSEQSFGKQIGGIVVGLLVSSGTVVFGGAAMAVMPGGIKSDVAYGLGFGIVGCTSLCLTILWRSRRLGFCIFICALLCLSFGIAYAIVFTIFPSPLVGGIASLSCGLVGGATNAMIFAALYAPPFAIAQRMAGSMAGSLAGSLGCSAGYMVFSTFNASLSWWPGLPVCVLCTMLGCTQSWWRPVLLYPFQSAWNSILYRRHQDQPGTIPSYYHWHTAFWDELQHLPMLGLDDYLVLLAENNLEVAQTAMQHLYAGSQRWAVQNAQVELEARRLAACKDVTSIRQVYETLKVIRADSLVGTILRDFQYISQNVDAALSLDSTYNKRQGLETVAKNLNNLLSGMLIQGDRYIATFRLVADCWLSIITSHKDNLKREADIAGEIINPYIVGVVLTWQQEIFVGRTDVSARIERLVLDRPCPPLLLYGQRRMGKTSLLYNLTRLLPRTIVPLYVDLQQACTAANHTGFLHKLVKSFSASANLQRDLVLPTLPIEQLEADPFTCFDDWVDEVEKRLGDQTAILTMDELNALEIPFSEHRFSEHQVMGMLRHLIQHRPRFKVLLATSFSIEELDTWASYLINAEVVPISYLSEEESYRLIERPVKDFTLVYQPEAARRIYQLTRGHPHLLQALCSAIVELKNKQPLISRRLCSLADVESAVPGALRKATTHFLVIESEKMDELALDILYFLARFPVGSYIRRELLARESPQASGASLALLLRRDLIEQHEDGFRFQVELVHHWFAQSPRRRWRR